jgi:hypothetical protein
VMMLVILIKKIINRLKVDYVRINVLQRQVCELKKKDRPTDTANGDEKVPLTMMAGSNGPPKSAVQVAVQPTMADLDDLPKVVVQIATQTKMAGPSGLPKGVIQVPM